MLVLEAIRKNKNLSQFRLASLAQVSQPTIAYIERGATRQPSVEVISKIGNALRVPPDLLLFDVKDLSAADKAILGIS